MEDEEKRIRMAVIAGAAQAVHFKEKNPRATEQKIIQHISDNIEDIINKIDNPL